MSSLPTIAVTATACGLGFLIVVSATSPVQGADPAARQVVEEAQRRGRSVSERYEGLLQTFEASGKTSEKRWMYSRIGSHGQSKVVIRFTDPAEVRGVALLIVNHPDRASDQWMWTPRSNGIGASRCRIGPRGSSAPISASRISRSATSISSTTRCSTTRRSMAQPAGRSSRRRRNRNHPSTRRKSNGFARTTTPGRASIPTSALTSSGG